MKHDPVIHTYCRSVGKALDLPRKHKRRLLVGLYQELAERYDPTKELTGEVLWDDVGPPKETAFSLMNSISETEQAQYRVHKKFWSRVVIVVLTVLLAITTVYYVYGEATQIDHSVVTITEYTSGKD